MSRIFEWSELWVGFRRLVVSLGKYILLVHSPSSAVDKGLQLGVLALDHLGHGLVEEVVGLVNSSRLVARGPVSSAKRAHP